MFDQKFYSDLDKVIKEIETVSSIELVVMVYRRSHNYYSNSLATSMFIALVLSIYFMFSPQVFNPWFIYFASLAAFVLSFFIIEIFPPIKRLIIPKSLKQRRPLIIAHSIFSQGRLCNTRDRTAILIYISLLEKQVIPIYDIGVEQIIPKDELERFNNDLKNIFKDKHPDMQLLNVLRKYKSMFAKYLPVKPDDINEIPDNFFIKIKL